MPICRPKQDKGHWSIASALLTALLLGCGSDDDEPGATQVDAGAHEGVCCYEPNNCPIRVRVYLPEIVRDAPLQVRGVADDAHGLAIRAIFAGSRGAIADKLNFAAWQVVLERSDLTALPTVAAEDGSTIAALPLKAIGYDGRTCTVEDRANTFRLALSEAPPATPDAAVELDASPDAAPDDAGPVNDD